MSKMEAFFFAILTALPGNVVKKKSLVINDPFQQSIDIWARNNA